jgi:hypothetical protein
LGCHEDLDMKKKRYVFRSARTGKFVSAAYAKRYPNQTVREAR